jgi:hypothetical protein
MLIFLPQAGAFAEDNVDSSGILADIRTYTYHTWKLAEKIEESITLALVYLNEWLITPDAANNQDTTARLQSDFSTYTNTILSTTQINNTLQSGLTKAFLGPYATPEVLPFANDITYQTLLGFPYYSKDPRETEEGTDPARNYIFNAAGLRLNHAIPRPDWKGTDASKQKYQDFYKTVSAIQTFNIHVLGELYADYKNGGAASAQQASLIQQASNSDWFSVVASEHIGLVLRQILMYNAQMLVVATQILQTQKELLASQAMTNSLMILNNQGNETVLLKTATGQLSAPL